MMKWLAITTAIVSLVACGGGSSGSSPTAPTAAVADANIGGSYNVTISAASTCSANLPSATRVLTYIADITQHGTVVQGQLLAHVIWSNQAVVGTVSGKTVTFSNFSFSENTTGGGVALVATGITNVGADGSITGTLSGIYAAPSGPTCNATSHQIQMVKK